MPNIERLIQEPTLDLLNKTVTKLETEGWKAIGPPEKSNTGF